MLIDCSTASPRVSTTAAAETIAHAVGGLVTHLAGRSLATSERIGVAARPTDDQPETAPAARRRLRTVAEQLSRYADHAADVMDACALIGRDHRGSIPCDPAILAAHEDRARAEGAAPEALVSSVMLDAIEADAVALRERLVAACMARVAATTYATPSGRRWTTITALPCKQITCPTCGPRVVAERAFQLRRQLREAPGTYLLVVVTLDPDAIPERLRGRPASTQLWALAGRRSPRARLLTRLAKLGETYHTVEFHGDRRPHVNILVRLRGEPTAETMEQVREWALRAGWGRVIERGGERVTLGIRVGVVRDCEAMPREMHKLTQIDPHYARVDLWGSSEGWWTSSREERERAWRRREDRETDRVRQAIERVAVDRRGWAVERGRRPEALRLITRVIAWGTVATVTAAMRQRDPTLVYAIDPVTGDAIEVMTARAGDAAERDARAAAWAERTADRYAVSESQPQRRAA